MNGVTMNMPRDRLGAKGWVLAALVAVAAFAIGFMWLPSLQAGAQGGLWDAICRAAGIYRPSAPALKTTLPAPNPHRRCLGRGDPAHGRFRRLPARQHARYVLWLRRMPRRERDQSGRHIPNLAGVPADVIYKQLDDYRSGKRQNPIMQGMAATLSDKQMADLAAHFAALPAAKQSSTDASAPALVRAGSPLRSIAPCAACHGPLGRKEGAPPLHGQKGAYLKAQLDAFATGTRHNDINQQMREVARALSASERDALAEWYGEVRHPN